VLWENSEIILDRIKNSANADQGLFGGMETKIALKKADNSALMERLMMEQEVFKAFVSGNPLDGLYKYIKKHTLISQIKDKAEIQHFKTICYIKEIQRARKKGFFIKVEDITETLEFFVADTCGLEKFNLLVIQGFKRNNRTQVTKIVKTSHDTLKELAGSSYDLTDTVAEVKKARYGAQKQEKITNIETIENDAVVVDEEMGDVVPVCDCETEEEAYDETVSLVPSEDEESKNEEQKTEELKDEQPTDEEPKDENATPEPDTNALLEHAKEILSEIVDPNLPFVIDSTLVKTMEDIRYVAELIKNNPGERKATILGKEVQISDDAIEALKEKF
jgi:hypothetical protein